jgi:DNA-binding NtrC family response regulator
MDSSATVLVVDDEERFHENVARALSSVRGLRRLAAYNVFQARDILHHESVDVVLLDLNMPGVRGDTLLQELKPDVEAGRMEIVVISANESVQSAVSCTKSGAFDYILKSAEVYRQVELLIKRALEHRRQRRAALVARAAVDAEEFVTNLVSSAAPEAKKAVYRANEFAASRVPVLIEGAPGSGVEHVAHFLHLQSSRSQAAFVVMDAKRLAPGELNAMLARGAGTKPGPSDAPPAGRPSELELADGGTLFLDSIEHLDPRVQRQLVPLMLGVSDGSDNAARRFDVRIVAACADGKAATLDSAVRQLLDLSKLRLPRLSERRDDIPLLLEWSAERRLVRAARPRWAPEAIRALQDYDWPRNVSELEELVVQLGATRAGAVIALADLPFQIVVAHLTRRADERPTVGENGGGKLYEMAMAHFQHTLLHHVLLAHGGDPSKAAAALGVPLGMLKKELNLPGGD